MAHKTYEAELIDDIIEVLEKNQVLTQKSLSSHIKLLHIMKTELGY